MASRRQRDLDRLIETSGASVYDEEAGCWSDGCDDESGWGLSSITNLAKGAAGLVRRGVGTSWKIATTPYSMARRIVGSRSSSPSPAYQQNYQQNYQQSYPQGYSQSYSQDPGYQDPGYQDPGYQDPGYQNQGYAQDYYPDQGY